MESDQEEEEVYMNRETEELVKVSQLLKTQNVDELLKADRKEIKETERGISWYHEILPRDAAEDLLKQGLVKFGNIDGLFLVRKSSTSSSEYVLSLVAEGKFFHFQINELKRMQFSIDDGPAIVGLDCLIQKYMEMPLGLPCKLTQFCKQYPPPHIARRRGTTNLLHNAVLQNIPENVEKILNSKFHPDIDAKSSSGSTALHLACEYGMEEIATILIKHGANVSILDYHLRTPVHVCCATNKAGLIPILVNDGHATLTDRCPTSGWLPIHEAAFKGHAECLMILLNFHSPYYPRADDGKTPLDIARSYDKTECVSILENFDSPGIKTKKSDWFHPELDRSGAQCLLESHGCKTGMFIIRNSRKISCHVISVCHQQKVYNYEIKSTHYDGKLVYFIDKGPYYKSLEHLVHCYSKYSHGMQCILTMSVNPAGEIIPLQEEDDYTNLAEAHELAVNMNDDYSPALPPRPSSLSDDTADQYAPSRSSREIINAKPDALKLRTSHPPSAPPPPVPSQPPPSKLPSQKSVEPACPPSPIAEPETDLRKIDKKCLKIGKEIGQGEFGSVVKGEYKKQEGRKTIKIDVAIKLFHKDSINNKNDFLKEARTMQQLKHECIVNFLGICESDKHDLMLVEEFIAMGSMLDFIIDCQDQIHVPNDLYLWAAQIAYGMMYLEEQKLVHRDLAARNILLQSKQRAKISDFGLSRALGSNSDYYKASTGGRWPIKWYAPECVNYGQFSHASDVWSFGVTLWEMFSFGEPPYGEMKGIEVIQYIESGKRLERPEKCPPKVYEIMNNCWKKDAKERPTFKYLNQHFEEDNEYASTKDTMKSVRKKK
ncbi:hypothetical protein CHS0354_023276 [Potamilus streckersoni]|uniref:Tyrosine-protein kinase n=1 Tax=Potamilus streckersoni TaxID=2493646 RepID=A0AAE0T5D9_9BIVA|nr:hypothetical protein CHS0354_023276 [Potamilus streckersoni]